MMDVSRSWPRDTPDLNSRSQSVRWAKVEDTCKTEHYVSWEAESQIRKLRMWIQIQHPNRQKLLRSMVGIRKWDGRETGTLRSKHMMIGFLLVLLISPTFWPCPAQCLCDLSPSSKTLKFSNVPGFCLRSFSSLNSYPLPGWSHSVAWL